MAILPAVGRVNVMAPGMRIVQPTSAAGLPWWNIDGLTPGGVGGTCLAAYQPKAGGLYFPANIAESYINRANPGTFDAAPGVAPAWAAGTGWTFDGLAQYLRMVIPGLTTASTLIIQFSNGASAGGNRTIMGSDAGGGGHRFSICPFRTVVLRAYRNGIAYSNPGAQVVAGNMCISGASAYLDGLPDGAIAIAGVPSANLYIGSLGLIQYQACDVIAAAVYGPTLAAPQVLARAIAMAAL